MKSEKSNINPQDTFAESLDGLYLVDAGAGTGKTHTIIRRYENLINRGVNPKNILLITFTRNAAEKMRNDVVTKKFEKEVNITDLLEAPILNFHAFCMRFLKKHGLNAPRILGMSEMLTSNFNVAEEEVYEHEIFRKFYLNFRKEKFSMYADIFKGLGDNFSTVLSIIKKLSSIGIFPNVKGWFGEGEELLKGSYLIYSDMFDTMNLRKDGKNKEVQNDLYKVVNGIKDKIFFDFKSEEWLEGCRAKEDLKEILFNDDEQEILLEFMRDVYFSYIEFMLKRNILNFDFIIMFAYLILYSDKKVREEAQYEYIMVDEFQDTDELQFLLLMLLCKDMDGQANLGVVGDWKQGIYEFRNTTIENITQFSERLSAYRNDLNKEEKKITYYTDPELITKITFEYNYRSSQDILDFSVQTLHCKGSSLDEVDHEKIKENFSEPLKSKRELDDVTELKFYESAEEDSESEIDLLLMKISELTNDKKFVLREFDHEGNVKSERRLKYSDICVLARNNEFGLKLQKAGIEKKIPVNFDGGLELFSSEQGILLLAWLRVMLNEKAIEGWIPILEKDGNKFNELNYLLGLIEKGNTEKEQDYFNELLTFREKLALESESMINILEMIFTRYGFDDVYCNAIITEFSKWTKSEILSSGELANLIDTLKNKRFKVEINSTDDAVIFQTIHGAKGLEYPVVILANLNKRIFPSSKNSINDIYFHPVTGLRMRKKFGTIGEYSGIFDNFRSEILIKMMNSVNYDEERRLLYVAVTRAKQYLYFTARNPSTFFTELSEKTGIQSENNFNYKIKPVEYKSDILSEEIKLDIPKQIDKKFVSVHSIMDEVKVKEKVFKNNESEQVVEAGIYSSEDTVGWFSVKGKISEALEYGNKIHLAAQKLAYNLNINSDSKEIKRISDFLNSSGADEILPEVDFLYPKGNEVIRGTIDLLLIYQNKIEIVDYKTDKNLNYLEKYKKQLKIYKEVIQEIYPDKKVFSKIFFTGLDKIINT